MKFLSLPFGPAMALRRLVLAVFIAAMSAVLSAGSALAADNAVSGRRAALVIGNSAYENLPKLPNAVNDAERISAVLRDANFEVTVGENLDKAGLEKTVIRCARSQHHTGPVGICVVGNGMRREMQHGHRGQVRPPQLRFPRV